jgi:hypothetical protein
VVIGTRPRVIERGQKGKKQRIERSSPTTTAVLLEEEMADAFLWLFWPL